jgi:hypothetical protein
MSISGMVYWLRYWWFYGTTQENYAMDAIKRFHPFAGLTHLEITAIKNPGL